MKSKEELEEMARPQTPRSDRLRAGYGSLLMLVPGGGCSCGRKCVRRLGHPGDCYPKDGE